MTGKTHDGHTYHVVQSPDQAPPIILEVDPMGINGRWPEDAPKQMVGQSFGMRWKGRLLLLKVVGAQLNPLNGRLRVICR